MGHVQQLKHRDGRWQGRVRASDGKERTKTFERKLDAQRWIATQEADVARGQWVDPRLGRITFEAHADEWRIHRYGLRDSSIERIDGVIDGHLLPRFGPVALSELVAADVRAMIADDLAAGFSGSSVRRHAIVLRTILDAAVADGRLGRNVAKGIKLPPEDARTMRFLDADQLAAVADAVPAHYRALVLTAGWVGMRWGELAGLRLQHVDLLRYKVRIVAQATEVGGRITLDQPPKSKAGRRTVSIPAALTDVLDEHFASDAVQRSGLAFPTVRGLPMRRSNWRKHWTKAVAATFGGTDLDSLVFHELRHTAASLAIAHGAHPVTVKERMGHSSISVTMDRYGHMFPSQDQALAEALDGTLRTSLAERARNRSGSVAHLRRSAG